MAGATAAKITLEGLSEDTALVFLDKAFDECLRILGTYDHNDWNDRFENDLDEGQKILVIELLDIAKDLMNITQTGEHEDEVGESLVKWRESLD